MHNRIHSNFQSHVWSRVSQIKDRLGICKPEIQSLIPRRGHFNISHCLHGRVNNANFPGIWSKVLSKRYFWRKNYNWKIHLNGTFSLKIAKISLQSQISLGMRPFLNSTFLFMHERERHRPHAGYCTTHRIRSCFPSRGLFNSVSEWVALQRDLLT